MVRKKANVTEEEWSTKWEDIVAEHNLPGAREPLVSRWKEYLGMLAEEAASGAGTVRPAILSTVIMDTQQGAASLGVLGLAPSVPDGQEGREKLNHCTTKNQMGGCMHALFTPAQFMQLLC